MAAVVLMSKRDSGYADTSTSYEFPTQYLRWFAPLERGEPIIAIIYEPHSRGTGRQAFVGWASISSPPKRSVRTTVAGRALWEVVYDDYVHEFGMPVRRDLAGEPIEGWLRDIVSEHRDIRTSGRSVRPLDDADLAKILQLGFAGSQDSTILYPERPPHLAESLVADRTRRLVSTLERASRFREGVVQAYEFRCAITQFSAGILGRGRVTSLVEAAHIDRLATADQTA